MLRDSQQRVFFFLSLFFFFFVCLFCFLFVCLFVLSCLLYGSQEFKTNNKTTKLHVHALLTEELKKLSGYMVCMATIIIIYFFFSPV